MYHPSSEAKFPRFINLRFNPEYGDSVFLQSICIHQQHFTLAQARRSYFEFSYTVMCISYLKCILPTCPSSYRSCKYKFPNNFCHKYFLCTPCFHTLAIFGAYLSTLYFLIFTKQDVRHEVSRYVTSFLGPPACCETSMSYFTQTCRLCDHIQGRQVSCELISLFDVFLTVHHEFIIY